MTNETKVGLQGILLEDPSIAIEALKWRLDTCRAGYTSRLYLPLTPAFVLSIAYGMLKAGKEDLYLGIGEVCSRERKADPWGNYAREAEIVRYFCGLYEGKISVNVSARVCEDKAVYVVGCLNSMEHDHSSARGFADGIDCLRNRHDLPLKRIDHRKDSSFAGSHSLRKIVSEAWVYKVGYGT